jgi:hypothetical protein
MQGMLNQMIPDAVWQILHGERADLATLWLQALGTDAVVVAGKASPEAYHDYEHEERFRGALPVLYDDGHATVIYGIPRLHPGIARVVDSAAIRGAGRIRGGDDANGLTKYVALVENPGQNPSNLAWRGFDEATIEAETGRGEAILVQETWDPSWHARERGAELPVRKENTMGFMLIDAPAGEHRIELRFETPLENRAGLALLVLTVAGMSLLFSAEFKTRR